MLSQKTITSIGLDYDVDNVYQISKEKRLDLRNGLASFCSTT